MSECRLIVEDEVNCSFVGLDRDTKKQLQEFLTWHVPGYVHVAAYKLGRWDGRISLCSSGRTYINLVDEHFIQIIEDAGYEIDFEDRRRFDEHIHPDPITEKTYTFYKDDEERHLRDYQVAAVNTALELGMGVFKMATGAGKSYVCAALTNRYLERGCKVIIVVPSLDLITQTAKSYRELGIDCGTFSGEEKIVKDCTITTWQSLNNYPEILEGTQVVIGDECHQTKARVLFDIFTVVGRNVPHRFGFTGTLPEGDLAKAQVRSVFGEVIFEKEAWELQRDGILADCHINILQTQEEITGGFPTYQSEYGYLTSNQPRLEWLAGVIKKIAQDGNTLVLVKHIKTGKILEELVDGSVFLSGSNKTEDRTREYESVQGRDDAILICTEGIASTGIDIPRIFNLVLMDPGKSFIRTIQSIGRGLRKAEDKDNVEIYDICANTKFSKRHLTSRKRYYKEARYKFSIKKVHY